MAQHSVIMTLLAICTLQTLMPRESIHNTVSGTQQSQQLSHSINYNPYKNVYYWLKSALTFHITLGYNYIIQGPCNFNAILTSSKDDLVPTLLFGKDNAIIYITDGKQAPLYLGNIPQSQSHFNALRTDTHLEPDARIALHTLNREFEQRFVWLKTHIQKDGSITQYEYSTTDDTAPTLIDLIRGVYYLNMRDDNKEKLAYVHCKAGKGRSATLIAAYLLYIYLIADKWQLDGTPINTLLTTDLSIKNIITYMKTLHPIVHINTRQIKALQEFYEELINAGSFENLYQKYQKEIDVRDAEFNNRT